MSLYTECRIGTEPNQTPGDKEAAQSTERGRGVGSPSIGGVVWCWQQASYVHTNIITAGLRSPW